MKKTLSLIFAIAAMASVSACNTIQGIGKDIEAAGKGITSGSETVEEEITGERKESE